jgi:hypothetical protein
MFSVPQDAFFPRKKLPNISLCVCLEGIPRWCVKQLTFVWYNVAFVTVLTWLIWHYYIIMAIDAVSWNKIEKYTPWSTIKSQRCPLHHITGDHLSSVRKGIRNATVLSETIMASKVIVAAMIQGLCCDIDSISLLQYCAQILLQQCVPRSFWQCDERCETADGLDLDLDLMDLMFCVYSEM